MFQIGLTSLMKIPLDETVLKILRAPGTQERLRSENHELVSDSGTRYNIECGIPQLVPDSSSEDPSAKDSRRYYDDLAAEYRGQDAFWNNAYDTEIWRLEHQLIQRRLGNSDAMLDVGCGFYPHFEFTYDRLVIAGDVSLSSLIVAKEFGDESRSVRLIQFDARVLPFQNESFGSVIAGGELLNHISNYAEALSEFWRVLKPSGILLVQVGGKWCLDSCWAMGDAFLGHIIGYSVKPREVLQFFRRPIDDVAVTWGITPAGDFRVKLLYVPKLRRALNQTGFEILEQYGANCISGLVPLPIQQQSKSPFIEALVCGLIRFDRAIARLPILRSLAGNVFFVCRKSPPNKAT